MVAVLVHLPDSSRLQLVTHVSHARLDWSAQREYWTCFAAELAALSQHGDPLGFQRLSAEDKRKFLVSNPEQHLHALEPYSRVIEHLWSAEWKWLKAGVA